MKPNSRLLLGSIIGLASTVFGETEQAVTAPPTVLSRTYIPGSLEVPAFTPPAPPVEKIVPAMRSDSAVTVPTANARTLTILRGEASTLPDIPEPGVVEQRPPRPFKVTVQSDRQNKVIQLGSIIERPDLEIFAEEIYKQGEQRGDLENTWTKRDHIHFGEVGFIDETVRRRNLTQLHEFRRRYGKLPTQPVSYTPKPGESMIRAAFKELSWENPYEVVGADDTFEAYLNGRLVDEVFQSTDRRFNPNAKSK